MSAVIINSRRCWENLGRLEGSFLAENGVDLEQFHVQRPIEAREPKVLWVGSEVARERKGYDQFLLPLLQDLKSRGIDCDFRLIDSCGGSKSDAQQMAEWYNSGTILVCASRGEGTPNIALEAAACGCTVVTTAVGNMPELIRDGVNGYLVKQEVGALRAGVLKAIENYPRLAANMQTEIQQWHWKSKSVPFYQFFRKVLLECNSRVGATRY